MNIHISVEGLFILEQDCLGSYSGKFITVIDRKSLIVTGDLTPV